MVDHNNTTTQTKKDKLHLRTSLNLDIAPVEKLYDVRAEILKIAHHNISLSKLVSTLLTLSMSDYDSKDIAGTVITAIRKSKK